MSVVDRSPRVLRVPVSRYADLHASVAREHQDWRERRRASLEQAGRSANATTTVHAVEAQLLDVTTALANRYGIPDLGNKSDPVDELVYIILSRRTREGAYQIAFDSLKERYATWEELAVAPDAEIESTIRFSGLSRRKARSLKLALGALIDRFGECTLDPTREWSDEDACAFLCSLAEVGPKSAACVMMCSLDRPAFPVDAHVGRVVERLGLFRRLGVELAGKDHKVKQRLLWDAVPPALRYPLHVTMVVHGRTTCLSARPRCGDCVISRHCDRTGLRTPDDMSSRTGR